MIMNRCCGVGRRWRKAEVPIERDGSVVLGVNSKCAHANHVGYLEGSTERVEQQSCTQAAALRLGMNGKAGEYQQRYGMAWHALDDPLGSVRMLNLSGYDRVETENLAVAHGNIGLRRIRLLRLQRMTLQKAIKLRLPAIELLDGMGAMQFLDAKQSRHDSLLNRTRKAR